MHQVLPTASVANESAIQDFVQTGARTVTGQIERELDATSDKATLSVNIDAVVTKLKQYAILVESIPNQVFESMTGLRAFLDSEMTHQIRVRIDRAVVDAVYAAGPQTELTGGDLVTRIRNAVALMRSDGANPSVLAVSPDSGADLDLMTQPGTDDYIFAVRATGSSSPLWNLRVVETPGLTDWPAMVIDPALLGTLYLGGLRLDLDPYSEFSKNLTTVRAEANALFHVRQVTGVCLLEAGS